jgi:bacterioferritin-associated ferredoxin
MFVCVCNAYRDSEIADAARNGARSACEAYEALGNGPNCGCCLDTAEDIIQQIHSAADAGDTALPAKTLA